MMCSKSPMHFRKLVFQLSTKSHFFKVWNILLSPKLASKVFISVLLPLQWSELDDSKLISPLTCPRVSFQKYFERNKDFRASKCEFGGQFFSEFPMFGKHFVICIYEFYRLFAVFGTGLKNFEQCVAFWPLWVGHIADGQKRLGNRPSPVYPVKEAKYVGLLKRANSWVLKMLFFEINTLELPLLANFTGPGFEAKTDTCPSNWLLKPKNFTSLLLW